MTTDPDTAMSRIGNKPIPIPAGTTVTIEDQKVSAAGPQGTLSLNIIDPVGVAVQDGFVVVTNRSGHKDHKKFHGLYRTLISNMLTGVSEGFTRRLEMTGVGYKAAIDGNELVLDVGFSTSKRLRIPEGIKVSIEKNTIITLWGIDKQQLGQFAADIRAVRPPEPYKGKGIHYEGEVIRRKAGKAGAGGKGGQ